MQELHPHKLFDIANNYLGWGDPGENGPGIWCIGIEEGTEWGREEPKKHPEELLLSGLDRGRRQIARLYQRTNGTWYESAQWDEYCPIFGVIASITTALSSSGLDLERYKKEKLWTKHSGVFHTNLYPLGKREDTLKAWPPYYKDLFGYGENDWDVYQEKVKDRLVQIQKRWRQYKPLATVCFGTSRDYATKFEFLFFDGQAPPLMKHPTHAIYYNEEKRFLICQHPSSPQWNRDGSNKEKLQIIQNKLKQEWQIKLP